MKAVAVIVLACVAACGGPAPPGSDGGVSTPVLTFATATVVCPDTVIDRIAADGEVSIVLTNVGTEPVVPALSLTVETDFAIEQTTCESIAPGASCDVVVQFAPHTLGARTTALVASVGEYSVSTTLVGTALPEPGLTATPAVHYDDVPVGTRQTRRLTVRNGSSVVARPYTVALAGPHVADFAVVVDTCSGIASAPNDTCAIDVEFQPSVTTLRTAQLVVTSANLGTLTIELDGSGFLPAVLEVSPDGAVFGSVFEQGASVAQSFNVTNTGTVPSPALQVTIAGADASAFTLTDGCAGATLAGGASCMFSVVFRPSSLGLRTATATVAAGTLVPVAVPLSGLGEPWQMQVTPSSGLGFGAVLVGTASTSQRLTIANTGSTATGPLSVELPGTVFQVTVDGCTGIDLAPGATCNLDVTAAPVARSFASASVVVQGTRGDKAVAVLHVAGIIPAALAAAPATVAFGDLQLTEGGTQSVLVSNAGDLPTGTISAVTVVGDDRADVTLTENCTGRSLVAFAACSFGVSFSPSHVGTAAIAVEIVSPGSTLTVPITSNVLPAPTIAVSPIALVLNPVTVGEPASQTLVVQGTGAATGPLTVALSGAHATDYAVTGDACSGQTLATNQACTITITVTSSAPGARNALLVVSGQPGGYRKVPLTAIALSQANLVISSSTLTFRDTGVGQVDTFGFLTITNTGQVPSGTLAAQFVGGDPAEFGVIADTCTGVSLGANAQCFVHTQFAPTKLATSTTDLVVSAAPGGTVTTTLSGTGLPPPILSSTVSSVAFPPQETFTGQSSSIEIRNLGGSTTGQFTMIVTGPHAAQFRPSSCTALPAGSFCPLTIEFLPTEVGTLSATLTVETEFAGSVTIALSGTATPGTKIVVSPSEFDFGLVLLNEVSEAKSFVATNIGQRDIAMFDTSVSCSSNAFEAVSTTCGSTLGAGASCQVDVVFHPVTPGVPPGCRLVFVEGTRVKGEAGLFGSAPF